MFNISCTNSNYCFNTEINNDREVENKEEFNVTLSIPHGTNAKYGNINSTRVIIIDDDCEFIKNIFIE